MMVETGLTPVLTVVNGAIRGASFPLRPGSRVIGRAATADIVLDDLHVSRRHAAVRLAAGRVSLADMGSTNGTWVNDELVLGVARLNDSDRIRIGRIELRFFDPGLALTDPVGLSLSALDRTRRPTLPMPLTAAPHPLRGARAADELAEQVPAGH
jgi:pSer/pThr/pTyr-binding forkhead associated (FHA) protein